MGVKKSTDCTRARCRSRRYTPASSKVFELTSTLRSSEMGSCGKTCRRACWLNLDAHPAQDESEVSLRICSRDIEVHLLSLHGGCSRRPVGDARVSHSETATVAAGKKRRG